MTATRQWSAVALLTAVYTVSFIDRQVINLLVDPIRIDLGLSDTEISLLQGLAFALPYVLLSLPMGRIVDIANRVRVLLLGLLVWTLACMCCGLARGFWQLAFARIGVGAGEATVTPASWSLLADWFPAEQRALPVSVFLMGPYLGAGISLLAGAEVMSWASGLGTVELPLIGLLAPWQITFIVVAAPGFALLLLMPMLSEPSRTDTLQLHTSLTLQQLLDIIWARRAVYGAYLLGAPFIVLVLYAFQAWIPSLLVRVHGFDIVDAGRIYGSIALVAGSVGVLSGPLIIKRLHARLDQDGAPLTIAMGAALLLIPVTVTMGLSASPKVAIAMVTAGSFLITVPMALFATGLQNSSPNEIRGLMAGAYVFMVNVVGLAFGPSSVALVTDAVFGRDDAVGLSLAVVCGCALLLAAMLLRQGQRAFQSEARHR